MIELRRVWKTYRIGKVDFSALRGVDLFIEKGEFVSIMGPSGSGKSTLLHIMGLLDTPTKGKVLVMGKDAGKMNDIRRSMLRREVFGFVFQQFNLIPRLTALENVMLPMMFAGIPEKERERRARKLLKAVGLEGKEMNRPSELSGGQQQRVAIARALANEPKVILADEPTGNLDSKTGKEIMDLLEGLNRKGRTLIVVTHDPEIGRRAGRVIRIKDGKIIEG